MPGGEGEAGGAGGEGGPGGEGGGASTGAGGGEGGACSRPKCALTFFLLPSSTVTVMTQGTVSIDSELAVPVAATCASSIVTVEKWSQELSSAQSPVAVPVSSHVHASSLMSLGRSGSELSKPGEMSTESTFAPSNRIELQAEVLPPRMVSWPVATLLVEPVIENSGASSEEPGEVVAGRTVWQRSWSGPDPSVHVPSSLPVPAVASSYDGLHEPVNVHWVALGASGEGEGGEGGTGGEGGGRGGLGGGAIGGFQQKTRTTPLPSPVPQSNF